MATITQSYTWTIPDPASATDYGGPKMPVAATAVEVSSYCVGGTSVSFNIEERSTVNVSGGYATQLLATDQTADADGTTTSSFLNSSLAEDCYPWLSVTTVTGEVTELCVTLSYQYTV